MWGGGTLWVPAGGGGVPRVRGLLCFFFFFWQCPWGMQCCDPACVVSLFFFWWPAVGGWQAARWVGRGSCGARHPPGGRAAAPVVASFLFLRSSAGRVAAAAAAAAARAVPAPAQRRWRRACRWAATAPPCEDGTRTARPVQLRGAAEGEGRRPCRRCTAGPVLPKFHGRPGSVRIFDQNFQYRVKHRPTPTDE